jgi:AAA+ superfamily predicted ATPase
MIDFEHMNNFQRDVRLKQAASHGGMKIATRDAPTVLKQIRDCLRGDLFTWTTARGTWQVRPTDAHDDAMHESPVNADETDPFERAMSLRQFFNGRDEPTALVLFDFDVYVKEDPRIRRFVVEAYQAARAGGHLLVMLSRTQELHDELADETQLVNHELPGRAALRTVIADVLDSHREGEVEAAEAEDTDAPEPMAADVDALLDKVSGLTSTRAADAVSLGVVEALLRGERTIDQDVVRAFKEKEIARMPGLELIKGPRRFADIVGYDNLKRYLMDASFAVDVEAAEHGVPAAKGAMLAGEPGTGKSVLPSAFANECGWLCFKLDPGSLRGKFVGESEQRTDQALQVISANTPCVVLVDEVERFFGEGGGEHDGGVGERLTGKLLSWAAEQQGAFLVFTSNNPMNLPAALVRKGRLDRFFHVGTPDVAQREAIWAYYLDKAPTALSEADVAALVKRSDQWVGSEVESAVGDARKTAWAAFKRKQREDPRPIAADFAESFAKPCHAVLYAEQVERMRDWAEKNATNANDAADGEAPAPKGKGKGKRARRISV